MPETINIRQFIRAMEPNEMGKFEPMSGFLLINMDGDEYMASFARFAAGRQNADDVSLINTINHETYHGMQTTASGYCFDKQRRLFALLNAMSELPTVELDPDVKEQIATMRAEAHGDRELLERADRAEAMVLSAKTIDFLNERAAPGDNSMIGALYPEFFKFQDELAQREAAQNADGLSIQGLLEGSAVTFTHQLAGGDAQAKIEAELAALPAVYSELYAMTRARVGERTLELLLPTVALALCYTEPHNAYVALLPMMAASEAGGALAYGRKMIANLPEIDGAGTILRTAVEVRKGDDSYRIYDKFIDDLAAGKSGVDAYAALAEPDAMNRVQSMPFAMATADGGVPAVQGAMDNDEFVARMAIMGMVLRAASRRMDELQLRNMQAEWARDVLGRLMDNLPPKTAAEDVPRG